MVQGVFGNDQFGSLILQAAQGIVAQSQSQQRLNLEMENFKRQQASFEARAQEEQRTLQLKEEQFELQKQAEARKAEAEKFNQEIAAGKLKVSQGKLDLDEREFLAKSIGGGSPLSPAARAEATQNIRRGAERLQLNRALAEYSDRAKLPTATIHSIAGANDLLQQRSDLLQRMGNQPNILDPELPGHKNAMRELRALQEEVGALRNFLDQSSVRQLALDSGGYKLPEELKLEAAREIYGSAFDPVALQLLESSEARAAQKTATLFETPEQVALFPDAVGQYKAGNRLPLVGMLGSRLRVDGAPDEGKIAAAIEQLKLMGVPPNEAIDMLYSVLGGQ